MNGVEDTNLPYRRNPNKVCRCSTLKEVDYNPQLFKWELYTMTSFQRTQYGKEKNSIFIVEKSDSISTR